MKKMSGTCLAAVLFLLLLTTVFHCLLSIHFNSFKVYEETDVFLVQIHANVVEYYCFEAQ